MKIRYLESLDGLNISQIDRGLFLYHGWQWAVIALNGDVLSVHTSHDKALKCMTDLVVESKTEPRSNKAWAS